VPRSLSSLSISFASLLTTIYSWKLTSILFEEYFPSLCLLYPLAESLATRSNSWRRQAHQK
ncbi:MAG: hypothetical protein L0I82_09485, partial [Lactiplantibacillus plantarum]|nr:hypothetical protein [Lactiplantibacillus plantarum]